MNLTAHFTLEELTASDVAARRGLDNAPPSEVIPALTRTAQGLERIRSLVGKPIHVNSAYRSKAVNDAVGSKDTSQHRNGEAADITCKGMPPRELAALIAENRVDLGVDQVILEFDAWVHVSFTDAPRHAILTIDASGTRTGLA